MKGSPDGFATRGEVFSKRVLAYVLVVGGWPAIIPIGAVIGGQAVSVPALGIVVIAAIGLLLMFAVNRITSRRVLPDPGKIPRIARKGSDLPAKLI